MPERCVDASLAVKWVLKGESQRKKAREFLLASLSAGFTLEPGERKLVPTGLAVEIPPGFYGRIAPRSGLAVKHGIDTLAGVIDAFKPDGETDVDRPIVPSKPLRLDTPT